MGKNTEISENDNFSSLKFRVIIISTAGFSSFSSRCSCSLNKLKNAIFYSSISKWKKEKTNLSRPWLMGSSSCCLLHTTAIKMNPSFFLSSAHCFSLSLTISLSLSLSQSVPITSLFPISGLPLQPILNPQLSVSQSLLVSLAFLLVPSSS